MIIIKNSNVVVGFLGFDFVGAVNKLESELAFIELDYKTACDDDNWSFINTLEAIIDCYREDIKLLKKGIIPSSMKVSTKIDTSTSDFLKELDEDEFPF